ncbi:hypothetical protein [Streptomyces sp. SGAir0957]
MRQDLGQAGPAQRSYTRDSDGTLLISDSATETIHGQWLNHSGGAGQGETQDYTYDGIGRRLTHVADTAEGTCTRRGYGFDNRTNRTSLTTTVGTPGSDCPTTGGTTRTSAYDSADRIVDSGYVYDTFGRTTALPGGTAVTYYANDLVRRQTAGNSRQTWTLDPANRFRGWTTESSTPQGTRSPMSTSTDARSTATASVRSTAPGARWSSRSGRTSTTCAAPTAPPTSSTDCGREGSRTTASFRRESRAIVAMIFPHPAVIAVCAIIAGASIAIQTTFGWTHFLYFYGYAYPWRGSC